MGDNDITLSMSMPLDADGFLRRQCPTCNREFKWLNTTDNDPDTAVNSGDGYFCPYCGIQAARSAWFTDAQVALAQNILAVEVVDPMLNKFSQDIQRSFKSNSMIRSTVRYDHTERLDPLTEVDDMVRVSFTCHPTEPVKVSEDWNKPVHCLICGHADN